MKHENQPPPPLFHSLFSFPFLSNPNRALIWPSLCNLALLVLRHAAPANVAAAITERTCGVVCILGDHYAGCYAPVAKTAEAVRKVNAAKGWQCAIHVDGASGGFVAPFQTGVPDWDFRVPEVLSISASGHKFGESVVGTGK